MIATVIFALPPAIRLTEPRHPQRARDIARGRRGRSASTTRQILRKVQLPLAKPSIMLGVNQTIMMALGIIVIAAMRGRPAAWGERCYDGAAAT